MFNSILKYNRRRKNFSGSICEILNSKKDYLRNFNIKGYSYQAAAPTPETPVEIQNVPSSLNITSCGKNLFNLQTVSGNLIIENNSRTIKTKSYANTSNYHYFIPNTTYTISYNGTLSPGASGGAYGSIFAYFDGINIFTLISTGQGKRTKTFTTPAVLPNNGLLNLYIYGTTNNEGNEYGYTYEDLVLTYEGVADRTWQAYTGQTTAFTVRDTDENLQELHSLPDGTRDEITSGKIIKRLKSLLLTGDSDENWDMRWNVYAGELCAKFSYLNSRTVYAGAGVISAISDRLEGTTAGTAHAQRNKELVYTYFYNETKPLEGAVITVSILKERLDLESWDTATTAQKVASFKRWLGTNNLNVVYKLPQIQIYDLAKDEQTKLERVMQYDDECYVYSNSHAILEFSAVTGK